MLLLLSYNKYDALLTSCQRSAKQDASFVLFQLPEKVRVRLEEKVAKREIRRREKDKPLDRAVEGNQQLNKASKAVFKKGQKTKAKQGEFNS